MLTTLGRLSPKSNKILPADWCEDVLTGIAGINAGTTESAVGWVVVEVELGLPVTPVVLRLFVGVVEEVVVVEDVDVGVGLIEVEVGAALDTVGLTAAAETF